MTPRPDPRRYESLVRECGARVYRAAFSVLGQAQDAQDVAGEVFLRLLDGRLDVDDARDPGAVLAAVAARVALQLLRGTGRRRRREVLHAMREPRDVPSPDLDPTAREERDLLRRELDRLPQDLRLPVALRFEGGLTYADIGAALGCAEPTAHDRVRRGLATLRRALTRAGLMALSLSLEQRLAAAPTPTPSGLEQRLLTLSSQVGAAAGGVAAWMPLVLGLAAAGGLAWAAPRWGASPPAAPAAASAAGLAALDPPAAVSAQDVPDQDARRPATPRPAAGDAPPAPVGPRGWVAGRVLDAQRFPLVDATLVVVSTDRQGKLPAFAGEGRTDADGTFRLAVDLPGERGRNVRVSVRRLGYVALQTQAVHVAPDETTALGELTLTLPDGDAEGEYAWTVQLVTPSGEPPPPALLQLDHLVRRPDASTGDWSAWLASGRVLRQRDASASSDATGQATLAGQRLGAKVLRVRPQDPRWAMIDVPLTVSAGVGEAVVPLVPARTVEGRLRTLDGEVPDGLTADLLWSKDTNVWTHVPIDAAGRFRVAGLAPDEYQLWIRPRGNAPWSTVRRRVGAAQSLVEVVLKRADDPRDLGDHAAELHGRLVDGRGRPATWRGIQVEEWWFDRAVGGDWQRDVLPNHLCSPPVQRAAAWSDPDDPHAAPPASAEFHLTGLQPGRRVIYLSLPGYALDVAGPFDLVEGELRAGLELRLRDPATVEVTVLDPRGRRLAGAGVFVTGTGPYSEQRVAQADGAFREVDGRGFFHANRFRRVERGAARLERLPAGRSLRLAVIHPDWQPVTSAEVVLTGGETRRLELRVHAPR